METKEQDNVDYKYVKLINKMKDFKFIFCLYARNESDICLPKSDTSTTFCLLLRHKRMNSISDDKSILYTIFQM